MAPPAISALVNREVVSQHAEEAAFLWTQRARAVAEPHYSLKDLMVLDERVEAHLDGLRVAGDVGWDFCAVNVANEGPGEVFALAVLAFGAGNRDRMREALSVGGGSPPLRSGLISALGWLDYADVAEWLGKLLAANSPMHRAIGIAAYAIHCEDPGRGLRPAIEDADPFLRARALRCAGEIKRRDLLDPIRAHLRDAHEACQYWAAWSLTLLGAPEGAPSLLRFVERDDAYGERALGLGLRAIELSESRRWISSLPREAKFMRLMVRGAGNVGDPAAVPWLIKKMELPELSRLAGEAFTMITGVDLAYHDLDQDGPPAPAEADAAVDIIPLDYESNLPWPCAARVEEWWGQHKDAFEAGTRYLGGRPVSRQSVIEILIEGKQRLRAAAALELALLDPDCLLFEVRSRGSEQQKRLEKWAR